MTLPLVVTAAVGGGKFENWMDENVQSIENELRQHGAVLLRGFAVDSSSTFEAGTRPVLGELMEYLEGASPRIELSPGIYTSTEYAPNLTVSMHNELSYGHQWPGRIAFYCQQPADEGGVTPIADSRRVLTRIDPKIVGRMLSEGVTYIRNMHSGRGPGIPWSTVFASSDKSVVESYCVTAGIDFEWLPNDILRTRQTRPAVVTHPATGELLWFNQAHQWHPSNAGAEVEAALRDVFGDRLPMNVVYGDGAPLEASVLTEIRAAYEAEKVVFEWNRGDVMILDNMLTAHGRSPFSGERRVLVAMGRPVLLDDVEAVANV
jgi:alpha-ketoglutarate-dependent taurine dioxygenase